MWIVKVINLQESLHHALSTPWQLPACRCPSENESSQLLSEYTTYVNREWAAKLVHLQDKHIPSDWLNDIEIKTLQCGHRWIHQIDGHDPGYVPQLQTCFPFENQIHWQNSYYTPSKQLPCTHPLASSLAPDCALVSILPATSKRLPSVEAMPCAIDSASVHSGSTSVET